MTRTPFDIEAHGLVKTYPHDVRALAGLDLEVAAGTVFGLLGPNGAGKSTTVRILTTLTTPDAGSARVAGHDALADPVRVRRAIGVVGQKHGADREATGRENLVLQGEFYGITGAELKRRVAASLDRFGLADAAVAAGQDLLRRHAAAARRRHGPHPPPAGALPRRAHHRARSRGARPDVGRDRAARPRGGHDHPAHHALPRGGRPARLTARDRGPRADRRPRDAGRAQERAARRHDPGRARQRRRAGGGRRAGGRRRRRAR